MPKRKPRSYEEEELYSEILGIGSYTSGRSPGTTKMKHPIGFIRPKTRPARPAVKKTK